MINPLLIKRKILPNGIRFIQFPRSQKMTAQLSLVIEYGSKPDSERNAGLAHFVEHMVMVGSKERIQTTRSIEKNGGYLNLFTDHDFTIGYTDVFPEKLNETSQFLSKFFFDFGFEEKKFDLEQEVILNEIDESLDDPFSVVDDMLRKNLYKNHPVRHPILGYHKTVSQFSINEIIETYQTYYTPENTILILSGKYSEKDAKAVAQSFAEIKKPKSTLKKCEYTEKEESKKLSNKTKTGISQTYLGFGYRTVSGNHQDNPALELFSAIMGNGVSSRLFRELREKRALTYGIDSSICNGQDFGFFAIECAVKSSKIEETTDLIIKEITKLKNKKISDNELLKVKNMVIGDFFRGIDDSLTLHISLTKLEILFADEYAISKYLEKIKFVSLDDLIEVANKYFGERNLSKAILTPNKMEHV